MSYAVVDEDLIERLDDEAERSQWLLLEAHVDFPGHWLVNSFDKDFFFNLKDIVGPYRAVSPASLADFMAAAEECEYKVAFFEDPTAIMDDYAALDAPPPFTINSNFEDTINGMLPFQLQGFNMLKDLDAGVLRWDTGAGKTVGAAALVKYHSERSDLTLFVVKKNNKINTARKLKRLAGLETERIRGPKDQRMRAYNRIIDRLESGEREIVVILNYENFLDFVKWEKKELVGLAPEGEKLFTGRDLTFIWDEMPTKLKTRTTRVYKSISTCLYTLPAPKVDWKSKRPAAMRQYMLSATPIENDPEDWFNCIRLMTGGRVYGSVKGFRDTYVRSYDFWDPNRPATWQDLDRMWLECAYMVHQADKTDPDIAKYFPEQVEEPYYVEWDAKNAKLYLQLQELAKELKDTDEAIHTFSLINMLQMICDAPSMVTNSAARREVYEAALEAFEEDGGEGTPPRVQGSDAALRLVERVKAEFSDDHHGKLETLRYLLTERHPDAKVVVFTAWNAALMPILKSFFEDWGVSYVHYTGTDAEKQAAQDAFQEDPNIRVFLSSDAGSDSIDLDAGSVVIHYDLPWKWTTKIQRQNRIHRPTSSFETVWVYLLLMENSVEDRRLEIIETKQGHHDGLFGGKAVDLSSSARMTKADLMYILTGQR